MASPSNMSQRIHYVTRHQYWYVTRRTGYLLDIHILENAGIWHHTLLKTDCLTDTTSCKRITRCWNNIDDEQNIYLIHTQITVFWIRGKSGIVVALNISESVSWHLVLQCFYLKTIYNQQNELSLHSKSTNRLGMPHSVENR